MLVLYTQPRCHFCEIMKRMLSKMDEAEGFQTLDITKDPEARAFLKKKGHKTVPMLYLKVPDHEIWINKDIDTGEIEVSIESLNVLGICKELPMPVFSDQEYQNIQNNPPLNASEISDIDGLKTTS